MSGPVPSFTMFPGPRWMDTEPHQPGRIQGGTFRGWLQKKQLREPTVPTRSNP